MFHRDFVPWRFSDAARISTQLAHQHRRPKTCTIGDYRERSALSIFTPNEQLCRSITDIGLKVLATPLYLD